MTEPVRRWSAGFCLSVLAWIGALGGGIAIAWRYRVAPGPTTTAPVRWPDGSRLPRATDRPTVVQFLHPRCPCSRASLAELGAVVEHAARRPAVVIVFLRPDGVPDEWVHTDRWRTAQRVLGATVVVDPGGAEMARFGARTSGETMVYGADGALRFAGGITPGRGELGDSAGRRDLVAALDDGGGGKTPVFGCALADREGATTPEHAP